MFWQHSSIYYTEELAIRIAQFDIQGTLELSILVSFFYGFKNLIESVPSTIVQTTLLSRNHTGAQISDTENLTLKYFIVTKKRGFIALGPVIQALKCSKTA